MLFLREATERKEELQREEVSLRESMLNFEKEKEKTYFGELKLKKEQLEVDRMKEQNHNNFNLQLLQNMNEDMKQQQE